MKKIGNKRALVGLSGGVDSSTAAFLLKKSGLDVSSVFFRFFENPVAEKRAEEVAKKIGISFYVCDKTKEFKESVINYFLKEIKTEKTPNPCVVCNRKMKFKTLIKESEKNKIDYIATGHYARVKQEFPTSKSQFPNIKLLKGKDKAKDQSYFLWSIKKEWLSKIIFPLGALKKEEVKEIAKKEGFLTSILKESQEVCFIEKDMNSFLRENMKLSPGKIIDYESKEEIGEHNGLFFHTIGQRKGLRLAGGPYYVLEKRRKENKLVVTKNKEKLERSELFYEKPNFFKEIDFPIEVEAKIRYQGRAQKALLEKGKVVFSSPVKAVTPGQSVVFYKGEELIGGGTISNSKS